MLIRISTLLMMLREGGKLCRSHSVIKLSWNERRVTCVGVTREPWLGTEQRYASSIHRQVTARIDLYGLQAASNAT